MTPGEQLNARSREQFDRLLEEILDELPANLHELLKEVPIIVDDRPGEEILARVPLAKNAILCGLHSGIPLTKRSVQQSGTMPETIRIFRDGICRAAAESPGKVREEKLRRQIRTTVLHEMGHHFGLNEEHLRELGYG